MINAAAFLVACGRKGGRPDRLSALAKKAGARLYLDMRRSVKGAIPYPITDLSGTTDLAYYYNELNYTPETWAEWNRTSDGFSVTDSRIKMTADGINWRQIHIPVQAKPSTNYLVLYEVVQNSLVNNLLTVAGMFGYRTMPREVGFQKLIAASNAEITSNRFGFQTGTDTEPAGNSVEIRKLRVIELPVGSRIEKDANLLTPAELDKKYPMVPKRALFSSIEYDRDTWSGWISNMSTWTKSRNGLVLPATNGSWTYIQFPTAIKPNVKYGLLINVVSNTLTTGVTIDPNAFIAPVASMAQIAGGETGIIKRTFTSIANIATNALRIVEGLNDTTGNAITLKDVRLFELPLGSQIDEDFSDLLPAELDTKYLYSTGKQIVQYSNDAFPTNLAGTVTSGYKEETFVVASGGVKHTFVNGLINGNSAQGIPEWPAWSATKSIVAGKLRITKANDGGGDYTLFIPYIFKAGRKYCVAVEGYQQTHVGTYAPPFSTRPLLSNTVITNIGSLANTTVLQDQSFVFSATGDAEALVLKGYYAPDSGAYVELGHVMIIDLTEAFGEGNEPTELTNIKKLGYFTSKEVQTKKQRLLVLDGTDDFMNLINTLGLDITQAPLSVFVTLKVSDAVTIDGYILARNTDDSTKMQYGLQYEFASGKVGGHLGAYPSKTQSERLNKEVWYNVGFIWDGQKVKMATSFIVNAGTDYTAELTSYPNTIIGRRHGANLNFKGQIGTITIYAGEKATEANVLAAEAAIARDYIGGGLV